MVDVEEFVSTVEDFVNTFKEDKLRNTGEELSKMHPTLQQNFMRLALAFIKAESEKRGYDDRNKATVELSRKMWGAVQKTEYFYKDTAYLPFI